MGQFCFVFSVCFFNCWETSNCEYNGSGMSDVNVSDDGCGISPAVAYC